jgi:hypothetical protein
LPENQDLSCYSLNGGVLSFSYSLRDVPLLPVDLIFLTAERYDS